MSSQPPTSKTGLTPIRYSLKDVLEDVEANAGTFDGVGTRLLDQQEIDRLFSNGDNNTSNSTD